MRLKMEVFRHRGVHACARLANHIDMRPTFQLHLTVRVGFHGSTKQKNQTTHMHITEIEACACHPHLIGAFMCTVTPLEDLYQC